jgi:transcriptional regulator with XRE-family HTH domain
MKGCIRCHGPTDHKGNCERCDRERKALGPSDAAARIAAMREMRGITQAELAKRCGLKPAAIGLFEQGRRRPCLRNLLKLCEGLRCTPNDILLPTLKLRHKMANPNDTRAPTKPLMAGCQQEPCSPSLKLARLYHFGDLPAAQRWGGVWQTIGVKFSQKEGESNVWTLRRVMACAEGEKIGEERETLEIILSTYCQRVQFHPLENVTTHTPGANEKPLK